MIKGMSHAGLFVRDVERAKKFYVEKLGFRVDCQAVQDDGTVVAMVKKNDITIEIVKLQGYENYNDGIFNHIAFLVDDINEAMTELQKRGIEFESAEPQRQKGIYNDVLFLMFRGAEGEHLEIDQLL